MSKVNFTYLVHGNFFSFLTLDAAQDGLDAHGELFHGEGLGDVVVGAEFEAFEDVFLERLGGEEDDGHIGVECADFLASVKPSFLGIITSSTQMSYLPFEECLVAGFAVAVEVGVKSLWPEDIL